MPKEYEIQTTWVVSTIHITERDSEILDHCLWIDQYRYGFLINVQDFDEDTLAQIASEGLSLALTNLVRRTAELGCDWLRLDCDGPELKDTPKFDW